MSDVPTDEQGQIHDPITFHLRPRISSSPSDTIPYTELPPAKDDDPLATEWNFYRREATRLLAEGHQGRWVPVKGEEIVGIWAAMEDAELAGLERYPDKRFLIHQVKEREPQLQIFWSFRKTTSIT